MGNKVFDRIQKKVQDAKKVEDLMDNDLWNSEMPIGDWMHITRSIEKKFGRPGIDKIRNFLK